MKNFLDIDRRNVIIERVGVHQGLTAPGVYI